MRYSSWRCALANEKDKPPAGIGGSAEEWPDLPPIPAWAEKRNIVPGACHILNRKGHPIATWWARPDNSCLMADAPPGTPAGVAAMTLADDRQLQETLCRGTTDASACSSAASATLPHKLTDLP
jgi:hypothetical protein